MHDAVVPGRQGSVRDAFLVTEGIASLRRDLGPLFVVVGVFDGLHRGHIYLLRQLRAAARRHTARPAVITFDAHPREIITGDAPPQLCDAEERLVRLAAAGVQVTVVQHFDRQLRETSYRDFVQMIRDHVDLAGFLMTPDAAFGHERRGTPEALAELGKALAFDVVVVPPLTLGERPVRSSEIRQAVANGDLASARRLLGRSFSVVGSRNATAQVPAGGATVPADGSERTPDWTTRLTFPVPAALPLPGRYAAAVGPAWRLQAPEPGAPVRAVVSVDDAGTGLGIVAEAPLPAADRLRVVFQRRLTSPVRGVSVARAGQA